MTSGPAPLHPADLSEALTAFALGLQRAATHPDGHPVLDGAAAELEGRLAALLVGPELIWIILICYVYIW